MKHSLQSRYLDYVGNLLASIREIENSITPENIHQFRVGVKKIRVMLRIMEQACCGKFRKDRHFRMMHKLFKPAGSVRELQVNIALCRETSGMNSFVEFLQEKLDKAVQQLQPGIRKFKPDKLEQLNKGLLHRLDSIPDTLLLTTTEDYLHEVQTRINRHLKASARKHSLHRFRKKFRELSEILIILGLFQNNSKLARMQKSAREINRQLGDWHDQTVLAETIKEFSDCKRGKERKFYRLTLTQLRDRNKVMAAELLLQISRFQETYPTLLLCHTAPSGCGK